MDNTTPNCAAALLMLDLMLNRYSTRTAEWIALAECASGTDDANQLRQRLDVEIDRPDSCWMWMLIDRTPSSVLEAATGRTRAEWFGLLVPPEHRYIA